MNFEEILNQYNIPIAPPGHEHVRLGWIQFDCPFCTPQSRRWRMGYNVTYRYVNCWTCGKHGLIETLRELIPDLSGHDARLLISELPHERVVLPEYAGKLILPKGLGSLQRIHRHYLRGRGYDPDQLASMWGLQGIGMAARLSWRIFIPIHYRGEMVSWTSRTTSGREDVTRYHSAGENEEAIPHKTLLYGEDYARHAIIITEGPADVWRIGPGAVATFGTGYSTSQVRKMAMYPRRAICLDNEPTAQKRARELLHWLEALPGKTINVELDAKDAGEASDKEIQRLRRAVLE